MSDTLKENLPEAPNSALERIKENAVTNMWGYSEKGLQAKQAAMAMLSTKNGMYARIPIVCKADECPYSESCALLPYDLAPQGECCPVEVAQIEQRCIEYYNNYDMDEGTFTDRCLVSEIVNADIMLERVKALMAKETVPVIDVIAGVSEQGDTYTRPEISRYFDIWDRLTRKRSELYSLMNGTRKDKKTGNNNGDENKKDLLTIINEADFERIEERPEEFNKKE